jgi:hypothetical protein
MPPWSVFVELGGGPIDGWDALDELGDAVERQPGHLGLSVAGGDTPSAYLVVSAETSQKACEEAESIVGRALKDLGWERPATATAVYDEEGRIVYERDPAE